MKALSKKGIAAFAIGFTSLCLFIILTGVRPVSAAEGQRSSPIVTWADLQDAIDQSVPGEVIVLTADLTALSTDSGLMIPPGKYLTLNLNGYTLDRNLDEWGEFGSVIQVNAGGALTVMDSCAPGGNDHRRLS